MSEKQPPLPDFESPDFYKRLGIDRYAALGEIKDAWRKLNKIYKTDNKHNLNARQKQEHDKIMTSINQAYNNLKTTDLRRKHDGHDSNAEIRIRQREEVYAARKAEERCREEEKANARRAAQERVAQERERKAAKATEAKSAQADRADTVGAQTENNQGADISDEELEARLKKEQREFINRNRARRDAEEAEVAAAQAVWRGGSTAESEPMADETHDTNTGTAERAGPDGRREPAMGAGVGPDAESQAEPDVGPETEPRVDQNEQPDGTQDWRDKWKGRLREAVVKVVGSTKEKFDWYKSSKDGLIRRNSELDAQAEKIGGKLQIERIFRSLGEKYNKMPFKYKLALGASLGLGAVLTAGSLTMALPLLGIAAQRVTGLATMYLKFEKKSHDETWGKNKEWGKQKAMLKAGMYTVLMGLTMKEAIEYASETEIAHATQAKIQEWLGNMMGHHVDTPVAEAPVRTPSPVPQTSPEASSLVAEPVAEAPAPAPQPEVVQHKPESAPTTKPEATPAPEAQLAAEPVAAASAGEIAEPEAEPEIKFEMPKHADFSIHEDDTEISPYDVTPTDNAQTDDVLSVEEVEEDVQDQPTEAPVPVIEPEEITLQKPTEPPMVDLTQSDSVERSSIPTSPEVIVNNTGLNIPISESHLYEGEGGRSFVLGGTTADHSKIIREFFAESENAKKVLYTPPVAGGSHVIGWIKSPDGAIMSTGPLEEENRNWLGMKKYVEKIDPNWLRKLIK